MSVQVPPSLRLVESFLNSVEVATGRDELGSPARFGAWLAVHRWAIGASTVSEDQVVLARDLREALRAHLSAHGDAGPTDPARRNALVRLDALAFDIPLRARMAADGAWLAPAADGVLGVLGELLAAVVLADHDGSLRRLKICRSDACRLAFYDWSKNASRCWCSMQICGNRSKTKAYRGRRRQLAPSGA
jgi:predicted RNA-binding Zn ribbon-like protein